VIADWRATRTLLERALELPAGERVRFVEAEAPDQVELREAVLRLLSSDSNADPVLDEDSAERLLASRGPGDLPERIGPYSIEGVLGEGGTATVFAARDARGRPVALKLLHEGLGGTQLERRFHAERDVLAALEHPGIVRVLDAGEHEGLPFLVTEWVDGVPIDRYVAERHAERDLCLALVLQVAAAVGHAHARLVVHRDLKPGNVLVDTAGRPKVLDFGVAKLLETPRGMTHPGSRAPYTPPYASPEQVRGELVTTASDVFSLGVLLRELLTGSTHGAGLRGEAAAVVACATQADPATRYAGMDAFASDISNLLAHRPVAAARPDPLTVAAKWMRRNPLPAVALGGGLLALLVGLGLTLLGRDRARASEGIAWSAHADAVWVTNYWADLLERIARGEVTEADDVRAFVHEAEVRIRLDLPERPEAEARMRHALARVLLALGERSEAERNARRALELSRGTRGLGSRDELANRDLLEEILRSD